MSTGSTSPSPSKSTKTGETELRSLELLDIQFEEDSEDLWESPDVRGSLLSSEGAEIPSPAQGQRITCLSPAREDVITQADLEAFEEECGEGAMGMMPVLLLGLGLLKWRRFP